MWAMAESPTKLQRWLDLIAYLVGRRLPVAGDELLARIPAYATGWNSAERTQQESARRMFERDKDELRNLGIPIQTVHYSTAGAQSEAEGYRIDRRDFYLPYLKLVEQYSGTAPYSGPTKTAQVEVSRKDARVALDALVRVADVPGFPLAAEARSAFRKLAFDLDPQEFASSKPALFVDRPGKAELLSRLRVLSDALLARKRIAFRYHGMYRGESTSREVATYGLLFKSGQWYLIGHDALRDDLRVFRVGRMEDVVANNKAPKQHDYEIPASFSLRAYADRKAWELGDADDTSIVARVRFHFPLSLWAERNNFGTLEARGTDGTAVRRFNVQQSNPFVRWILGMHGEAEILEPVELREELEELKRRVREAHAHD